MKNKLLILLTLLLVISCGRTDEQEVTKEQFQQEQEQEQEYTVTKNSDTGEFIIQIIVPETATYDEIYEALQDVQLRTRKEYSEDNIMIVAYSDARFTYKGLFGTHGQYKLSKGIEEYTKLSPKEKAISEEDKKAYLDYLSVFSSNLSTDSNIDTAKKEAASFIKAKYNEQIAVDADEYLFGIEKEKTEKEKMMDTTK